MTSCRRSRARLHLCLPVSLASTPASSKENGPHPYVAVHGPPGRVVAGRRCPALRCAASICLSAWRPRTGVRTPTGPCSRPAGRRANHSGRPRPRFLPDKANLFFLRLSQVASAWLGGDRSSHRQVRAFTRTVAHPECLASFQLTSSCRFATDSSEIANHMILSHALSITSNSQCRLLF